MLLNNKYYIDKTQSGKWLMGQKNLKNWYLFQTQHMHIGVCLIKCLEVRIKLEVFLKRISFFAFL